MDGTLLQRPDRTAMLAALERLVNLESPSLDKARCDACADAVAHLFKEVTGAVAKRHPRDRRGDHLEFHVGEGTGAAVVILCHHDTVWETGTLRRLPFRVDGDRVIGPGSYDMKAGIVEAAFALAARPRRPVIVLSTSDEEVGSGSSRDLIEATAREAAAVLVLEPAQSGGALKTARKGIADFTLDIEGRAAHAGVEPEKGISAIDELAHQVLSLRTLADPARGTTINVGVVHGGTRPNVVAAQAHADIDVRFSRPDEAERVVNAIRGLKARVEGAHLQISGGVDRPPMVRGEGTARLAALTQRLAKEIGFELTETSTGGGSDGNFTAALGIPTLDGLGPDGGGAHADSEHLLVGSWLNRTVLLERLIDAI